VAIADIGQVTFARDSARLDQASTALLDRLLPMLRKSALRLEGHADRDETDAAVLSLKRARAVLRYLVARGVPAAQLVAAGYAATRCVAPSDTEENRRENRRVELVQPED
jgi:outer membrane protein OmpA-like peptidoglycan-associated protein